MDLISRNENVIYSPNSLTVNAPSTFTQPVSMENYPMGTGVYTLTGLSANIVVASNTTYYYDGMTVPTTVVGTPNVSLATAHSIVPLKEGLYFLSITFTGTIASTPGNIWISVIDNGSTIVEETNATSLGETNFPIVATCSTILYMYTTHVYQMALLSLPTAFTITNVRFSCVQLWTLK
jgi:hypothetical protein